MRGILVAPAALLCVLAALTSVESRGARYGAGRDFSLSSDRARASRESTTTRGSRGSLSPDDNPITSQEGAPGPRTTASIFPFFIGQQCPLKRPPFCNRRDKFRTIDGSCNNLRRPNWGRSEQPFARILRPDLDRVDQMRTRGRNGQLLPSARAVTTQVLAVATDSDKSPQKLSTLFILWGQFMDHDFTFTAETPAANPPCCENSQSANCIPISIPENDPFYDPSRTCIELTRSEALNAGECALRHREQLNELTSFIDASQVYGSTDEIALELREKSGGKLRTSSGDLLPVAPAGTTCDIPAADSDQRCFFAGDSRSNEWAPLTSLHTTFVRLHNKIAQVFYNKLRITEPHLSSAERDERAYQETRRVVGAIIQRITYGEFLPNLLGSRLMRRFRLNLGDRPIYRSSVNPTVFSSFATAAFRVGHSFIPFGLSLVDRQYNNMSSKAIPLDDTFNQPSTFRNVEEENDIIRGVTRHLCLRANDRFADGLRDRLFAKTFGGAAEFFGQDLPARNVQRGRDHGIPSYNAFRRFCRLSTARSFYDLRDHSRELQRRFADVYDHPDDIDVFAGGVSEKVPRGSQVGPLFGCLIATQFKRFKEGDRFWFENQRDNPNPFTRRQISQLRQFTLGKIICETTDSTKVPRDVFFTNSPLVHCDYLPGLDLYNWL